MMNTTNETMKRRFGVQPARGRKTLEEEELENV